MAATARKPHRVLGRVTGLINPLVLRVAHRVPFYGVLEHRGRRSGRVFRTPLAAIRTADGFVLPLAFGAESNWVQNVMHAGGATIEWLGRPYRVGDPRVVDWAEGSAALSPLQRRAAPIFGVRSFLKVTTPAPGLTR